MLVKFSETLWRPSLSPIPVRYQLNLLIIETSNFRRSNNKRFVKPIADTNIIESVIPFEETSWSYFFI